jgi:hypothetical protein
MMKLNATPTTGPRLVKELVEPMMPCTAFGADGIPASGWPLLSADSAVSRQHNPTPEQKLAHHARHRDQFPSDRTRLARCRADAGYPATQSRGLLYV